MNPFFLRLVCAVIALLLAGASCLAEPVETTPERWESEIRHYEQQDRHGLPAPGGILFVGSSSIRMWTTLAEDFPGLPVLDRGFGGAQIREVTAFAERIVLPYRPATIVFYAGDNDLVDLRTPDMVLNDFRQFVDTVRARLPQVRILFISIKPSPSRAALTPQIREANRLVQRYIKTGTQRRMDYIDVFEPMLRANGDIRDELFTSDGLHMNRAGYRLWTQQVAPYLGAPRRQPRRPRHA